MPSMPDVIAHYQRSIEKSAQEPDRLLHCLDKLFKLDITVQHLQDTGIGRTVNTLRKYTGNVGEAARALVAKWKTMVTAHESGHESDNTSNDDEECLDRLEPSTSSDPSPSKQHHPHKSASIASTSAATSHSKPHSGHSHSNGNSGGDAGGSSSAKQSASSHSRTSHSSSSSNKTNSNATSSSGRHEKRVEASGSSSSRTPHEKSTHHKSSRHNAADTGAVSMPTPSTSSGSNNKRKADDASASRRPKEPKLASNGGGASDKKKSQTVQEIDSSMGTSFADALGMMTPNKKSTTSSKLKSAAASSSATPAPHTSSRTAAVPSSSSASSSSSSSSPLMQPSTSKSSAAPKPVYKKPTAPPTLLTSAAKLAPLDPAIAVAISNDYRPLPPNPIIMECVYKGSAQPTASVVPKTMSDAELGASMSSKNMRTKVYSGVKTGALLNVPSLYELCIRVLQRNIEGLEATGGVPFEILQPVLERTTPEQLFTLEDFNPYLMDDTGDLWMKHCSRKFRGQKPHEFESWRDMFLRCREEQELRLSHLTENIKRTQTVAVPVKQTKITFVDTAVKPPRDVLKKQARFGTERLPVCTPAARVASLNHSASNLARPGDARLRVMAGMRDTAQVNNARVPKKAPLMQKTLQHMKGLFKR